MVSDKAERVGVQLMDCGVIGIAEASCARRYLCEDPMRIGRRV